MIAIAGPLVIASARVAADMDGCGLVDGAPLDTPDGSVWLDGGEPERRLPAWSGWTAGS